MINGRKEQANVDSSQSSIMAYLNLWISSPDTHSERRIGSDITISQLKVSLSLSLSPLSHDIHSTLLHPVEQSKLEPVTGISYDSQLLSLRRTGDGAGHSGSGSKGGELLAMLNDENRTLDSYGVREWMTIRVSSPPYINQREGY